MSHYYYVLPHYENRRREVSFKHYIQILNLQYYDTVSKPGQAGNKSEGLC